VNRREVPVFANVSVFGQAPGDMLIILRGWAGKDGSVKLLRYRMRSEAGNAHRRELSSRRLKSLPREKLSPAAGLCSMPT
jgi:hypothetical protein